MRLTSNAARRGLNLRPLILGCARSALILGRFPLGAEGVPVRLTGGGDNRGSLGDGGEGRRRGRVRG